MQLKGSPGSKGCENVRGVDVVARALVVVDGGSVLEQILVAQLFSVLHQ